MIACFNENNWLDAGIEKVGQGSVKRYVDSRYVVRIIDEQGEAIGRLHEKIVNTTKYISIMSTTMGGMAQDLRSYVKEMEYYAVKLHQVEKRVKVPFNMTTARSEER